MVKTFAVLIAIFVTWNVNGRLVFCAPEFNLHFLLMEYPGAKTNSTHLYIVRKVFEVQCAV